MPQNMSTDSILRYPVGKFGEMGYAVPNWGDDVKTKNYNIAELVSLVGENLFLVMHEDDIFMRTPPSINVIRMIHSLYVRVGKLLDSRSLEDGDMRFKSVHSTPALTVFKVYPVPFFSVANTWLRRWCELTLRCISEMMQHTENATTDDITIHFAKIVGAYMNRIYINMAIELFGVSKDVATAPGFVLSEEQLKAYNWSQFVTLTESVDTVSPLSWSVTEDSIRVLRAGIAVTDLPELEPYSDGGEITTAATKAAEAKPAFVMPVP